MNKYKDFSDNKLMKKLLIVILFSLFSILYAQSLPPQLTGIWEGNDRIIFFESENNQLTALLKEYYGWYFDRAAEPAEFNEKEKRSRNSATPRNAEHIPLLITQKENTNIFEAQIEISKYQKNYIPFVILEDRIYLNFFEKVGIPENKVENDRYSGFYKGNLPSKGFQICEQSIPENIACFYIIDNKIYNIRYWLTDMEYSEELVSFKYKEHSFEIPKHIETGGKLYTCVNGRSKHIRNTQPPRDFIEQDYLFDKDYSFFITDAKPYLYKIVPKDDFDKLMLIVKEANSRRDPLPNPPFPPSNLDWHWDIIDELEKDNELIQQVRQRQKAFGLRGKDIGK